jgi:eukaryotic-like serine/threonine-protein kinase
VLGLGLGAVLYVLTQSQPAPVATNPAVNTPASSPTTAPTNSAADRATTDRLATAIKALDERKIQAGDKVSLQAAIDSAAKIPQSSSDYAKAQSLSVDAVRLSEAISLANGGNLKQAIAAAEKISNQSPIFKKASAYLEEWKLY